MKSHLYGAAIKETVRRHVSFKIYLSEPQPPIKYYECYITPNMKTFNVPKTCKQIPLRYIQVAWTGSVI